MGADALSDVLNSVRLTGAVFFTITANAPWVAEQPARAKILQRLMPHASHLIGYHVITRGRCYANLIGGEPVPLEAGEGIVFTQGDGHVVSSSPGMRAAPGAPDAIDAGGDGELPFRITMGDTGADPAQFVCGYLACGEQPFNPLFRSLPRVMKVGEAPDNAGWLGELSRRAMAEAAEPRTGGASVLAKLSELMFIEVVRRHIESVAPEQDGWIAGLRDPFVGQAISVLHAAPAQAWTIDELAKRVGLSRSVLAERFTAKAGMPPMQYLAQWRMQIAAGMLRDGANVATVAAETGYGSEAAFSRAFKKLVGMAPSTWGRQQRR